jgi:hypothetical protein
MKHTNPIYWSKCFVKAIIDIKIRKMLGIKRIIRTYLFCLLYSHPLTIIKDIRYKKYINKLKKIYNL